MAIYLPWVAWCLGARRTLQGGSGSPGIWTLPLTPDNQRRVRVYPVSSSGQVGDGSEMKPDYRWLLGPGTAGRLERWWTDVGAGRVPPGARVASRLREEPVAESTPEAILKLLLATRSPRIFAESEVAGDGSDWTAAELALLGDVCCAMPVTVYDDGRYSAPRIHRPPFAAHLVFVPGALLSQGRGTLSPDWREVVRDGDIDPTAWAHLYQRRLGPAFEWIAATAAGLGREAVVTVPGLGCGMFAGPFRGRLGVRLGRVLKDLLDARGHRWPAIRLVRYDPWNEGDNEEWQAPGGPVLRIRPFARGRGRPQLSRPGDFGEGDEDLAGAALFSIVAWDHVSWPGNDFWGGARSTDDGVKAAATDTMYRITGIRGAYDPDRARYQPPEGHATWGDLAATRGIRLQVDGNLQIL